MTRKQTHPSRRRTRLAAVALLASTASALSLDDLQRNDNLSFFCQSAYNSPIAGCSLSEIQAGSCDSTCQNGLVVTQTLVQAACGAVLGSSDSLIAQAINGNLADFVCNRKKTTVTATRSSTTTFTRATATAASTTAQQGGSTTTTTTASVVGATTFATQTQTTTTTSSQAQATSTSSTGSNTVSVSTTTTATDASASTTTTSTNAASSTTTSTNQSATQSQGTTSVGAQSTSGSATTTTSSDSSQRTSSSGGGSPFDTSGAADRAAPWTLMVGSSLLAAVVGSAVFL